MAEKPTKKTVAITIKRERSPVTRVFVATGFKLRSDKSTGMVEVLLEVTGQRGERITLDPVVLQSNLHVLKQYAASLIGAEDDAVQKDDVTAGEAITFANIVHVSQMAGRAETIFGVFSVSDWVEATKQGKQDTPEIKSYDAIVVISSAAFQKKLLLELVLLLSPQEK